MITIIGGGISGITTGLTLQFLGVETQIYAKYLVGDHPHEDPRFASSFPAASVIPHSVQSGRIGTLFSDSMQVFEALHANAFPAMEKHRHYELYEFPVDEPDYAKYLKNYNSIQEVGAALIPKRPEIDEVFGWAFDCFITEWPEYISKLYDLYRKKGGIIHQKKLERDEIRRLSSDIIINCAGIWSSQLFNDDQQPLIIRGHLIHMSEQPKIRDSRGRICSYNYTPRTSVYATPGGDPCDVYFYPIGNKWIIGGSRQRGRLNEDGEWGGSKASDTLLVDGIEVPKKIIELNSAILENTYHTSLPQNEQLQAFIGYRFSRDLDENGLRLERTEELGKTVIHNYGHGGAGVTLSWGSAFEVAQLLNAEVNPANIAEMMG